MSSEPGHAGRGRRFSRISENNRRNPAVSLEDPSCKMHCLVQGLGTRLDTALEAGQQLSDLNGAHRWRQSTGPWGVRACGCVYLFTRESVCAHVQVCTSTRVHTYLHV